MPTRLYKYVSSTSLEKVLGAADHVTLRCSYPKDFNDPYELFLTVDFNDEPDVLAFYADAVGAIPQQPTTCFSRSPTVLPMWAHYAENLSGCVIEFDESKIADIFKGSGFGDVDYQDRPSEDLTSYLGRAFGLAKPRYLYLLGRGVFSAAYYTKATCWTYEQERRMVLSPDEVRSDGDLMLVDIPADCVTGLICGPKASQRVRDAVRQKADELKCSQFTLQIGRSSPTPYFVDGDGTSYGFDGSQIGVTELICERCEEPLVKPTNAVSCSWCRIEDHHRNEATARNSFRMLDQLGLLDEYMERMNDVGKDT